MPREAPADPEREVSKTHAFGGQVRRAPQPGAGERSGAPARIWGAEGIPGDDPSGEYP